MQMLNSQPTPPPAPPPCVFVMSVSAFVELMVAMACSWLLQLIVCYVAYLLVNCNESIRVFDGCADDASVVSNHGDRRLAFSVNIGSTASSETQGQLVGSIACSW